MRRILPAEAAPPELPLRRTGSRKRQLQNHQTPQQARMVCAGRRRAGRKQGGECERKGSGDEQQPNLASLAARGLLLRLRLLRAVARVRRLLLLLCWHGRPPGVRTVVVPESTTLARPRQLGGLAKGVTVEALYTAQQPRLPHAAHLRASRNRPEVPQALGDLRCHNVAPRRVELRRK